MKVIVSGSSGLVGTALVGELSAGGDIVTRLQRSFPKEKKGKAVHWDPGTGTVDIAGLEGQDAVVHLAGENIAGAPWSPERKKKIRDSRIVGTRFLCESLLRLERPQIGWCAHRQPGITGTGEKRSSGRKAGRGKGFSPGCAGTGKRQPKRSPGKGCGWSICASEWC